jgi:hypothetical protein
MLRLRSNTIMTSRGAAAAPQAPLQDAACTTPVEPWPMPIAGAKKKFIVSVVLRTMVLQRSPAWGSHAWKARLRLVVQPDAQEPPTDGPQE